MGIFRSLAEWTRPPAILRDQGDTARDAGEWAKAASLYSQYLARMPEDAAIWVQFGHAEKEAGNHEAAEQAYLRALSIERGNPDTQVMLGHVLKLMGNHDEAVARYRKALELDPAFGPALEELASCGLTSNVAPTRSRLSVAPADIPKDNPPAAPPDPSRSHPPAVLDLSRRPSPAGPLDHSRSRPPSAPLDLTDLDRRVGLLAQQYASVKTLANELERLRSRISELEDRVVGQDRILAKFAASSGSSRSEIDIEMSKGESPAPAVGTSKAHRRQ